MNPQFASKAGPGPRVGTVTSVSLADSSCTVLVSEGEVPAYLTDQTIDTIAVGAIATLLPVGDTYQIIATRGGTTGSGGVGASYGPELLPNNGFEYGTDVPTGWAWWPWVHGVYSAARDTTPGTTVSGSARLLVTLSPDAVDAPDVNAFSTQAIRVDSGVTYQGTAWVNASALEASLVTEMYVITAGSADNAGIFGAGSTKTVLATVSSPGAAYQLLTGTVTVPAFHHYARFFLHCTASNAIGAPIAVSWDEASLRQRITS